MNEKRNSFFGAAGGLLAMFLGLPTCLLMLLAGLIVCCTFGFSLCLTIAGLVSHAWWDGISGTELYSDLQVSGVVFAAGAIVAGVSSKLFVSALRACRKWRP